VRIISGKYKGRAFQPPKNLPVRPTTDFAKTGLFNLLSNRIDFQACCSLDLFAGTGSISLELASRGCNSVTSVDRDAGCIQFIKNTIERLEEKNILAIKSDVFKYLSSCKSKFDIIFADPPFEAVYRKDLHEFVFNNGLLKENGMLVIEHTSSESWEHLPHFDFSRSYGNVAFSFFRKFDLDTNA
jgi:16S rRNA (guanine(966)-N(2))-methyltransferase RsmD